MAGSQLIEFDFHRKKKQVSICLKGLRYEFRIPLAPVGITTFAQLIERA